MKDLIKNNVVSILVLTAIIGSGLAFAAGANITSITQTAQTGDSMTPEWVNAVNTKLNTVGASGGGGCVQVSNQQWCLDYLRTKGRPDSLTYNSSNYKVIEWTQNLDCQSGYWYYYQFGNVTYGSNLYFCGSN